MTKNSKTIKLWQDLGKRSARRGLSLPYSFREFRSHVYEALDCGVCYYCLLPLTIENMSPDHTTPSCKGGSENLDNIKIICLACNYDKGRRSERIYMSMSPWARRWADGSVIPCRNR